MEYIPSPVGAGGTFPLSLASKGSSGVPKNTARWLLRISKDVFTTMAPKGLSVNADRRLEIVTRIGPDLSTGAVWPTPHQPLNRSVTYAWWAASPNAVPATERCWRSVFSVRRI